MFLFSGYAARRSKLTKSVTFTDTFTSPPKSPLPSPLLKDRPEAGTSANLTDDGKRFFNLTPITEVSPLTPVVCEPPTPLLTVSTISNLPQTPLSVSNGATKPVASVTCSQGLIAPMLPQLPALSSYLSSPETGVASSDTLSNLSNSELILPKLPMSSAQDSNFSVNSSCTSQNSKSSLSSRSIVPCIEPNCVTSCNSVTSFSDLVTSSLSNVTSPTITSGGDTNFSPGLNLNPDLIPFPSANNGESKVSSKQKSKSKMRRKFSKRKMISNEEEYFSNVLGGIKAVIEDHLVSVNVNLRVKL